MSSPEARAVNISLVIPFDNMTLNVSSLSNAELDSLLRNLFGESSTADKRAMDPNICDDSDIAGICNLTDGKMDIDQSVENLPEQPYTMPNQIYSSKDEEISYLKGRIDLLSKKLVDKTDEVESKDDELNLINVKLNNAEKANERLQNKLISYGNIIKRMGASKPKENTDANMSTIVNEIAGKDQSDISKESVIVPASVVEVGHPVKLDTRVVKNKQSKCKFENTGTCRKKRCPYFHPRKTCQAHSKFGECSLPMCEFRHPLGVCFEWRQKGACFYGDGCRNRHPNEMLRHQYVTHVYDDRFLGPSYNQHMMPGLQKYPLPVPPSNIVKRSNC